MQNALQASTTESISKPVLTWKQGTHGQTLNLYLTWKPGTHGQTPNLYLT